MASIFSIVDEKKVELEFFNCRKQPIMASIYYILYSKDDVKKMELEFANCRKQLIMVSK